MKCRLSQKSWPWAWAWAGCEGRKISEGPIGEADDLGGQCRWAQTWRRHSSLCHEPPLPGSCGQGLCPGRLSGCVRASKRVGLYTLTKCTSAKPPPVMKSPGVSSARHYMMGSARTAPVKGQVAALTEKYKVQNKRLPSYWIFKTRV